MKRYIPFVPLVTALTAVACGDDKQSSQRAQRLAIPVVGVPSKTGTGYAVYPVSIEGTINSDVRAKVTGYVTAVLVDEGQKVSKGQTLFRLETQALSQAPGAAKANVNAAQVKVDKLPT